MILIVYFFIIVVNFLGCRDLELEGFVEEEVQGDTEGERAQ